VKQSRKNETGVSGTIASDLVYTGGMTTPMPTRGPGIISTAPPGIVIIGAFKLIMACAVRFINGELSEIDPGVILIVLNP
jgi:hypothetical protein